MVKINMRQMAIDVATTVPGADSIVKVQKILKAFMGQLVIMFNDEEIIALVKRYRKAK